MVAVRVLVMAIASVVVGGAVVVAGRGRFGVVVVRGVEEPDPESTPLAGCGAETAVLRPTQFVRNCMRARPMG